MPRPHGRPITNKKKFIFYPGCTHSRIFPDSPIYERYIAIFGEPEDQITPSTSDTPPGPGPVELPEE